MTYWILLIAFIFPDGSSITMKHKEPKASLVECNQIWLDTEFNEGVTKYGEVLGAVVRWKCIQEDTVGA